MATVTHYPGINGEIGQIDLRTTSQTIAIDYSPTKFIITRAGKEYVIDLPSIPSLKDPAETSAAVKTAALWCIIGMALMYAGGVCAAITSDYKNSLPKKALCVLFTVVF